MTLSYWETVAVGWRILWQGPELMRSAPSYWALAVPLLAACVLSLFVLLPLVVRGLINGPFGTFRLVVERDDLCRSVV